jgi:hypothetical protein
LSDTIDRKEDFFSRAGLRAGIKAGTKVIKAIEIVGFGCKEGFETKAIFKELSDIIGRIEDFFSEAVVGAVTGVGIGIATGVFEVVGIAGLEIRGATVGPVEIGAASDAGSSCARHGKTVS